MPPSLETISDPVMANFVSKQQVHLNHSAEVFVGYLAIVSLINSKMGYVPEYHTTIWCAMGDIMKKLISHVAVLYNLDINAIMK